MNQHTREEVRKICQDLSQDNELASPLAQIVLQCLEEIEFLQECLQDIADPVAALKRDAIAEGNEINPMIAVMFSNNAQYLRTEASRMLQHYENKFSQLKL